nr:hypothetical protein [Tanacetum cinerariifolium]
NSFTYDTIPECYDEVPNPPPQCHFNIYVCQICERNSRYGYECSQRVLLVYEPEPCYIQNFSDNDYSHDLPNVDPLIDHHCCYECGNSLNDFFCPRCNCEFCGNGAHVGYSCPAQVPTFQTLPSFPQQYPCCEDSAKAQNWKLPVCYDDDDDEERSNSLQDNIISGLSTCSAVTPNEPVDSLSMGDKHLDTISATKSDEFIKSYVENLVPNPSESEGKNGCDVPACFTTFSYDLFDADYESDSSDYQSCSDEDFPEEIFLNPLFEEEIIPMKIDQHHFNVDDYQSCSDEDFLEEIFLNPLFEEEIIPMKIDQHHFNAESDFIESMLNHDSFIISSSSKIDSLLDEFADELTLLKSIPPRIDETDCYPEEDIRLTNRLLYDNSSPRPPEEFVSENSDVDIESFSPSP